MGFDPFGLALGSIYTYGGGTYVYIFCLEGYALLVVQYDDL